jgi:hypothetical protein
VVLQTRWQALLLYRNQKTTLFERRAERESEEIAKALSASYYEKNE